MDRGAWQAKVHGVQTVGHDLATEQSQERLIDPVCVPDFVINNFNNSRIIMI